MRSDFDGFDLEPSGKDDEGSDGLGLALLALAVGAGSALLFAPVGGAQTRKVVQGRLRDLRGGAEDAIERVQREFGRRQARRRQERRASALIGLAVGAGLAALLVPESGRDTRHRLTATLRRRRQDKADEGAARVVREPQADPEPVA
jgi:gas vesicle protein